MNNTELLETITCPITQNVIFDPVIGSDGKTYERNAILEWLINNNTSPITRQPMTANSLTTNYAVKYLIDLYNSKTSEAITTDNAQSPEIDFSFKISYNNHTIDDPHLCINIYDNIDAENYKIYTDLVLIIDRSGSMSTNVTAKNEFGSNIEAGFSIQDIVNHAAKTIVNTLNENDRITIIAFDNEIELIGSPFTKTTKENIYNISLNIDKIKPRRQTAIWNALKEGFHYINCRNDKSRNPSIMILTDGAPNISPARGEVDTLIRARNEGLYNVPIYTFGFGYSLQKNLLYELSKYGDGAFGHISDGGMIATVFNNFIATIMSTICINVQLIIEFQNEVELEVILEKNNPVKGDFIYNINKNLLIINLGSIQIEQYKCIILNFKSGCNPERISSKTLCYLNYNNNNQIIQTKKIPLNIYTTYDNTNDYYRYKTIDILKKCCLNRKSEINSEDTIDTFIKSFENNIPDNDFRLNLEKTLNDQVRKAVSCNGLEFCYFNKWGEFYIEQLIRALNQQIKPNFKDAICHSFGGKFFESIVDKSSDIFDSLPPPIPSNLINGQRQQTYTSSPPRYASLANNYYNVNSASSPTINPYYRSLGESQISSNNQNMSQYNNPDNGCFSANSLVKLSDNSLINIKNLEKNMKVCTFDPKNNFQAKSSKVIALIKINYNEYKNIIKFTDSNLEITNYHPIYDNNTNKWGFPIESEKSKTSNSVNCVYNIIVEDNHIIEVNSVKCITFGHNYNFNILKHPYFGSDKIINDLRKFTNFNKGFIEINESNIYRDNNTNLVNKIIE